MERTGTNQTRLRNKLQIESFGSVFVGRRPISSGHLSDILKGSRLPSLPVALELSRITGVAVEKLLPWHSFRFKRKSQTSVQKGDAKCA